MWSVSSNQFKEVIIIGNGPSAILLSFMLDGNWPYYDPIEPHPNEELHCRLTSFLDYELKEGDENDESLGDDKNVNIWNKSLVQSDLAYLCSGLTGRSLNPVSILFDTLQHPDADFGSDLSSTLTWKHHVKKKIDHLVIGQGVPGGAWATMSNSNDILTISLKKWMQLPGLNEDFDQRANNRVTLNKMAKYYHGYVEQQGLSKYFKNKSIVSKIKYNEEKGLWEVIGCQKDAGYFQYITPNVVLATGIYEIPNRLEVKGEDLPFVIKTSKEYEKLLNSDLINNITDPIMIVGAGLRAADAIILARSKRIPVVHVFRKHPNDPSHVFNHLSEKTYPEYFKVFQKMKSKIQSSGYKAYSMHAVSHIDERQQVVLQSLSLSNFGSSQTIIKVSFVVTLIGMKPNLDFIQPQELRDSLVYRPGQPINNQNNLIKIDPYTHQCVGVKGLYAIGPLVGDNFVRFVQGGALAILSHIWKKNLLK